MGMTLPDLPRSNANSHTTVAEFLRKHGPSTLAQICGSDTQQARDSTRNLMTSHPDLFVRCAKQKGQRSGLWELKEATP